jgi:acyl carrier protein
METELAAIWAEVLGLDQVGIHDNLLALGGDSLLATRISAQLMRRFKVDLPINTLFESPTVAKMAEILLLGQARTTGEEDLGRILREVESLSDEETRNHLKNS